MWPHITLVAQWMKNDENSIPTKNIVKSFKKYYISNELNYKEDNILILIHNEIDVQKIHLHEITDMYDDLSI